jgi:hypothetical protein
MRLYRSLAAGVACLSLLATSARADGPARLVPAEADLLAEVPNPRRLVETGLNLQVYKQIQDLPQVKELLGSTAYRRFNQLVAHFEKELGAPWPELLDRLAGDGAALGVKFTPGKVPVLLVLAGKDEELAGKAFEAAVKVLEGELARQESKEGLTRLELPGKNMAGVKVGDGFFFVRAGKVLLAGNVEEGVRKAVELYEGKGGKSLADEPTVGEAAKLVPADALARVWINYESVRKLPGAEEAFKTPRDPGLSVLFGSYLDVLGRTPYLAAAVTLDKGEAVLTVRAPRGREGMGAEGVLHMPPEGQPGSRPLLQPRGTLYSYSFYLDFAKIWTDRKAIFGEQNAKGIEEADKNSGKLPVGNFQLSKVLTQSGPYHRFVVATQPKIAYKRQPKLALPAFGFVTEMRDPDNFSRTIEAALRAAALFAGNQVGLQLAEEKYNDVAIVAYRFDEAREVKQDVNDIRFNFNPCFCRVGDQFVVCSTVDLCKELIDILKAEAKGQDKGAAQTARHRFYAAGVAEVLSKFEDQLVAQAVLDQAIPAEEARAQVKALIKLVSGWGSLGIDVSFLAKEWRYEFRVK